MEKDFWITAWKEGRTNFNQGHYNKKLLQYFPEFHPKAGQKVFVPLCGKSKDMVWLSEQNLEVFGIELYEQAVKEFYLENNNPKNVTIKTGDFFEYHEKNVFDFVYDRAALIALPEEMRKPYSQIVKASLKKGGLYLLIAIEYDQSERPGPPFSVPEAEIRALYEDEFEVTLKETEKPLPGDRFAEIKGFVDKVYVMRKK